MTLRAIAGENPTLSVATDAELSAIDTGFLVNGDRVWSDESGEYIYRSDSSAVAGIGVIFTLNSDGGTLPGRFLATGTGPTGSPITLTTVAYTKFDGGNPPVVTVALGVAVARTALGVYTLTLSTGVALAAFSIDGSIDDGSGTPVSFNIFDTSATVKTLFAFDAAGAATDTFTVHALVQSVS